MSSEELIQVTISPTHIRAGAPQNIDIRLSNNGPGQCANIILSIRLSTGLVLLKGAGKIQLNTLAVGESFNSTLRVKASNPGIYRLTSRSFSYRDYRGYSHQVRDFTAEVVVEPGQQAELRPQLSAELLSDQLGLGVWGALLGIVTNVGDADAFEVAASLSGQAIDAEETGNFVSRVLAPGSSQDLTFHVLPHDAGTHVPVHLDLSYRGPDGKRYYTEERYTVQVRDDAKQGGDDAKAQKMMKILFLGASPPDLPRLRIDEEIREIEQEIRLGRESDRIQIETKWAVRPRDISRALLDVEPDIVHFSGHGGGGEESFIAEDATGMATQVPVAGLVNLFKVACKNVSCLLVNACSTQQLAIELSSALPHTYVIGMREPVGDQSAIWFSVGFYQGMAVGRSVTDAFDLGKAQMMMAYDSATAPVLLRGNEDVSHR